MNNKTWITPQDPGHGNVDSTPNSVVLHSGMGKLRNYLRGLFSPTPPHTAEEKERMAEARPATPQEIAEAKAKHGWKTNLPGSA